MIPLRDNIPALRRPVVTVVLIVVNVIVFMFELSAGRGLDRFLVTLGVVPALQVAYWTQAPHLVTHWAPPLLTSMFLHGGWLHLIGNMWFLWVFGDNVEDRLGRLRFLAFYLACGVAAALTQVWFNPASRVPMIGASGAIAGVLGAYLLLYPRARVVTFIPIFFFPYLIQVPAFLFLGVWFFEQLWAGAFSLSMVSRQAAGVAWWAHAGGFVAGFLLAVPAKRRRQPRVYRSWEEYRRDRWRE